MGGLGEDIPAVLGGGGGGEGLFEVLDGDVGIEEAAESAVDEEAAGDAELQVAQVLDSDPGDQAENHDDQPGSAAIHHH